MAARIEARGRPVPENLIPPPILPGFSEWWGAFWELGTDRQIGNVLGPIPAASIARHTAGWPEAEADMFRTCIRRMDGVYLRHVSPGDDIDAGDGDDTAARDAFRAAFTRSDG